MAKTKNAVRKEFIYLNRLRESGVSNMFGASPYIATKFNLGKREASAVLVEWMDWVNENPDNVNL